MKKTYVLGKKEKPSASKIKEHEKKLAEVYKQIKSLGYDKEVFEELDVILKTHRYHDLYVEGRMDEEVILLAKKHTNWKPVFNLTSELEYESSFEAIEKLVQSKRSSHTIYVISGKNEKKKELTFEQFKKETLHAKYEGFGMGKKWNKKEDTLWDYL